MSYVKGQSYNFNFADLTLYSIGTIEYRPTSHDYSTRVGLVNGAGQYIYINAFHSTFDSALANVHFIRDGKKDGKLTNIYGNILDVHISPRPRPNTTVIEVLGLVYSWDNL